MVRARGSHWLSAERTPPLQRELEAQGAKSLGDPSCIDLFAAEVLVQVSQRRLIRRLAFTPFTNSPREFNYVPIPVSITRRFACCR